MPLVYDHFPKFVPDQLLTSDDLNQLFGYLDEQSRLTRTNLIGIGIVCGLEVKTSSDRTSITITKGCGVTSGGYLITFPETTYTKYKEYDPVKELTYNKFVDDAKIKRFNLWELKQSAVVDGTTPLDSAFLVHKVVLLFVELLQEDNKNCDPDSCDDKGSKIKVNFVPLIISDLDVNSLIDIRGSSLTPDKFYSLKQIKIRRFKAAIHSLTPDDIFIVYRSILSMDFIESIQEKLTAVYEKFKDFILDEFPSNPFSQLKPNFVHIYAISIPDNVKMNIQYYYDFFSDLILAYDEFRKKGSDILSMCCPHSDLFNRHLLLGEAIQTGEPLSNNRHYFIYSPLYERKNLLGELKSLFKRMVLMFQNFYLPEAISNPIGGTQDENIRITPGSLGSPPLSLRAIPYYYKVKDGSNVNNYLYKYWDFNKTIQGKETTNLSYHANLYSDELIIINPLNYDIEQYNFLRVEGIIGKSLNVVLVNIKNLIKYRGLPFDVIALKAAAPDPANINFDETDCNFRDLELNYDIARKELESNIRKILNLIISIAIELIDHGDGNEGRSSDFRTTLLFVKNNYLSLDSFTKFIEKYTEAEFIINFRTLGINASSIRTDLRRLLNDDTLPTSKKVIGEDIIDHLDELILNYLKDPFKIIIDEFNNRIEDVYSNMFFSYFSNKHPGIQHKAGVTMGGTFIVVYDAQNIVIADFYLPYLCCSDCSPIQYVISEPTPIIKTCSDLRVIVGRFRTLDDLPPGPNDPFQIYSTFIGAFIKFNENKDTDGIVIDNYTYTKIQDLFYGGEDTVGLDNIVDEGFEGHVRFFADFDMSKFSRWILILKYMIIEDERFMSIKLELFSILFNLLMYICCVRTTEADDTMLRIFDSVNKDLTDIDNKEDFSGADKILLNIFVDHLTNSVDAEITIMTNNRDLENKKNYVGKLNLIKDTLATMSF